MRCTDEKVSKSKLGRTLGVIVLLLIAAAVFSYLWAYALSDALVAGHLMAQIEPDADPRPAQMKQAFVIITSVFLLSAAFLKWISWRQIRRIDAMDRD